MVINEYFRDQHFSYGFILFYFLCVTSAVWMRRISRPVCRRVHSSDGYTTLDHHRGFMRLRSASKKVQQN